MMIWWKKFTFIYCVRMPTLTAWQFPELTHPCLWHSTGGHAGINRTGQKLKFYYDNMNTSSMTNQPNSVFDTLLSVQLSFQAKVKMGFNQNSCTSKIGQNNTYKVKICLYKILKHMSFYGDWHNTRVKSLFLCVPVYL